MSTHPATDWLNLAWPSSLGPDGHFKSYKAGRSVLGGVQTNKINGAYNKYSRLSSRKGWGKEGQTPGLTEDLMYACRFVMAGSPDASKRRPSTAIATWTSHQWQRNPAHVEKLCNAICDLCNQVSALVKTESRSAKVYRTF